MKFLACAEKLTGSQLDLPHRTKTENNSVKNWKQKINRSYSSEYPSE